MSQGDDGAYDAGAALIGNRKIFSLASTQQAVWLDQLLAPQLPCYNIGGAVQFDGHIQLDLWERAIQEVIRRNDALRLMLVDLTPVAGQQVLDELAFKLERHDYSAHADGEQRARAHMRAAFSKPFALYGGVLWEMQWVQATQMRGFCLFRYHHLVVDGASMSLICNAIFNTYSRLVRGDPLEHSPAPSYLDFVADDLAYQNSARYAKDQEFWFSRFSRTPSPLFQPDAQQGVKRPAQQVVWEIERREFSRMAATAGDMGGSITHLLIAALAIHFSRITDNRPEVVIGMPVHNRKNAIEKRTTGMFSSVLALPVAVNARASFGETIRALVSQAKACYRHQRFPLYEVARHAQKGSQDHSRLFDLMVSIAQFPREVEVEGGHLLMVSQQNGFEDVPLALHLHDYEKTTPSVRIEFNFDPQVLTREEVQASVNRIERLLRAGIDMPHTPVRQLPLLDEPERSKVLHAWNATEATFPAHRCIHELFEEQVARTPKATAVVFEDTGLTYAELDARANRLAHHLIDLGVRPDSRVALALPRGIHMVVALLATLKAGGAYVPLDPAYPVERLAFLLDDCRPRVVLTDAVVQERLPASRALLTATVLDLDDASTWAHRPAVDSKPVALGLTASHLAYVIYTSGSTGAPKGVMVPHTGLVNYLHWAVSAYAPGVGSVVSSSLSFDATVTSLYAPLLCGGSVTLLPEHGEIDTLQALVGDPHRAGLVKITPAHLDVLGQKLRALGLPCRADVFVIGGEALPASVVQLWRELAPDTRLINEYGPTETVVGCVVYALNDDTPVPARVPIGRPIANTRIYILDTHGEPVPVGLAGEIHIGGAGVARGYLHQPELTAERFVCDPFAGRPDARMYRTGDLGRWRPDGTIEYLGRNDHQVKIRGFRIEPGEIEARLLIQPGVREAVVIAREDKPGHKRLVAYFTGATSVEPEVLRHHLAGVLPEYMVPAAYVRLETLPLTPNGKLDRRALPAPEGEAYGARTWEAPEGELEVTLAAMWRELLCVERVGRHDDFFALGGHSLLAVQLSSRIHARLGCEVPLTQLFAQPTLAGFARRVTAAHTSVLPAIVPTSRDEATLPLSFAQQRLWFLAQFDKRAGAAYSIPGALRLRGVLNAAAMQAALGRIVARHEALRTRFVSVGKGSPAQVIAKPGLGFALAQVDLSSHAEPEVEFNRLASEEARAPFDLTHGPLIRGHLLRLGDLDHVLLLAMHHIVSDGWSIGVLLHELRALYAAFVQGKPDPLPALAVQYADYAVWQRRWMAGDLLQRQIDFWRRHLSGAPALLELPTDRPRPPVQDYTGGSLHFELDAQLSSALKELAQRHGSTLFMTLLASWAALLSRLSGQDEVVIGTPVANRHRAEIEPLIGFFVNTLALRIDLSGQPTVAQLLAQVRTTTLAAQEHQDVPYEQVVETLNPPRSLAHSPVFQVMFSWDTPEVTLELPGLQARQVATDSGTLKFDLEVSMREVGAGIAGSMAYASALFDMATVERHLEHWQTLLRALVADDAALIARLPLLSAAERQQLVHCNASEPSFAADRCIQHLFEAQVQRTPDADALVFEQSTLSYAELNARANRLAHHLVAMGVGPDSRVAIALPRSAELVVALWATLKAGGAYVPLDPDYPAERLRFMLADSAPRVLLTEAHMASALGALPPSLTVLKLDAATRPWDRLPAADPTIPGLMPSQLAYVIYTSGSTGTPKGVMVEHAGLVARIHGLVERYRFTPEDRVLQFATLTFDASVEELFCTLCTGATLVMRTDGWIDSAAAFWSRCAEAAVTVVDVPTRFLQQLVEPTASVIPAHVRLVIVGGEELPPSMPQRWSEAHRCTLLNTYGPTEAIVVATAQEVKPGDSSGGSIGHPVPHARLYIVDPHGEPVPTGVAGEIHIGGAAIARGYLNRPELTADRFVPDPFIGQPGARMYKTGDLGRWRLDGTIQFLGRNDHQVKIRGFRVELGEIESRLLQHPGVREAVVLAHEHAPGDKRLLAYVVADEPLTPDALRTHVAASLPEYMVPAAYVRLGALPLTPHGKLDRRALPAPEDGAFAQRAYQAPQGELEGALASLWSELLCVERVGRHDDFFALGGHSLLAVQLASRIRVRFGCDVALAELFAQPTLAGFALRVAAAGASTLPAIVPASRDESLPLSFAQQRLWFLAQLDEDASTAYLMPGGVRLVGALDRTALRAALDRIVERHEALRTGFSCVDDAPVQVIMAPDVGFALQELDLSRQAEPEADLERLAAEEAASPLDLVHGPLIRGHLLRLAEHEHVLLVTMHHIVSDGWSTGVFIKELCALYAAFAQGQPDPLPSLVVQYADYAVWQRQWIAGDLLQRQLDFWRAHLSGAPALLELPTDRPRPPVQDHAGASIVFELDAGLSGDLKALGRRHGTTLFMTLLAAWAALLSRLSGQDEVVIGTPVANRHRAEIEPLIGFFVNTLALRVDLSSEPTVAELLAQVRTHALAAQDHQDIPFEQVVEALNPVRTLAHSPVFQVMFAWQNALEGSLALPGLQLTPVSCESHAIKFDLEVSMHEAGERIAGSIGYARALFDAATIERILAHWQTLLRGMVADDVARVHTLPLLSDTEREQLLHGWNATETFPAEGCIHQLFEDQAARTPQAVALVFEDSTLSYAELNGRANQLARHLTTLGVGPDTCVAIALPRSPHMVVALLATLKAGGAYVPLDPDYPTERLAFMLADSAPRALITQTGVRAALGELPRSLAVLQLDAPTRPWDALSATDIDTHALGLRPSHLAYVIYTSGSTGAPKGAMNEHRAVVNRLLWMQQAYALGAADAVLQKTPFGFDVSVWEFFWPWLAGARLVLARPQGQRDPDYLLDLIERQQVTTLHFVPSMLPVFLTRVPEGGAASLRRIVCSGEALPAHMVEAVHRQLPRARLYNLYGPTEAAVDVTAGEPQPGKPVSIGRPIANTRIYILDRQGGPVPVGVPGEIHIGGVQVGRGYLNRPDLTAERFIPDPFASAPHARLYKTGDLGRWLADGNIEFLGRNDHQVKVRGLRIELGEIEARLSQHPGVREAVVLAREDSPGDKRLVAYVTGDDPLPTETIRQHLSACLPEHMVPAAYVRLDTLPLTPHGKLDRRALPPPEDSALGSRVYEPPRGELEVALAAIWGELLRVERIGRQDDFFALGGHSLMAVTLVSRLREKLKAELTLRQLFDARGFSQMARAVRLAKAQALLRSSGGP